MSFKKILCFLAVLIMAVSMLTACAPPDNEEEVECPVDKIIPISITDSSNTDKVNTTANFTIGNELKESVSAFELSPIISNDMMLQANVVTRIWGQSSENGKMAVRVKEWLTGHCFS